MRVILCSLLVALLTGCPALRDQPEAPVHWILHDRNATSGSIFFRASSPNAHSPTGLGLFHERRREAGRGGLTHSASFVELPYNLRYHWSIGPDQHWRFDDLHPYALIPADVIRRSRGWAYEPPPLLVRITFLPEGRLRFSWHACVDASCAERGSPSLRFDAEHEFQGYRVAEAPQTRGF